MKILSELYRKYLLSRVKRLNLRDWAKMEDIRKLMSDYAENGGWKPISDLVVKLINLCGVKGDFRNQPWFFTASLFSESQHKNSPITKFPMLNTKEESVSTPWDYHGRSWSWWVNLFASAYGWREDVVANLDIEQALGLYQEIQVDMQLEREFQYGLTEVAYEYVPATKKSKFRPLPRPDWMLVTKESYKPRQKPKVKIRKDMLPVGMVVNLDEE